MMFLFVIWMGCTPKEPAVVQNPVQTVKPVEVKPVEKEDEVRPADEAMILLVPDSVSTVTLATCGRTRKSVRHGQVRFFDVPNEECRIRFSPSGLFTSLAGGVGVHHCRILANNSSVICTLCQEGLDKCLLPSMNHVPIEE